MAFKNFDFAQLAAGALDGQSLSDALVDELRAVQALSALERGSSGSRHLLTFAFSRLGMRMLEGQAGLIVCPALGIYQAPWVPASRLVSFSAFSRSLPERAILAADSVVCGQSERVTELTTRLAELNALYTILVVRLFGELATADDVHDAAQRANANHARPLLVLCSAEGSPSGAPISFFTVGG